MQKLDVVCRFFRKDRRDLPGQKQLQCYLGTKESGTVHVIDFESPIPASSVKEGVPYYCNINKTLAESDRVTVVTVGVLEEIDFSKGTFGTSSRGQWQCSVESDNGVFYTFIIDSNCKKTPAVVGESWNFTLNKVIAVDKDEVIMSVILNEPIISDRAKRRREKKGIGQAA